MDKFCMKKLPLRKRLQKGESKYNKQQLCVVCGEPTAKATTIFCNANNEDATAMKYIKQLVGWRKKWIHF